MIAFAGWWMTNTWMADATAMVVARIAKPPRAVTGIKTNAPPMISTIPVKYRNHWPTPTWSKNLTH